MKSERGQIGLVVAVLLLIVIVGMVLVARNGNDVFTSFWGMFHGLVAYSSGG